MDTEKLMQIYPNVSRGELEKIRKTTPFLIPCSSIDCFPRIVESIDMKRGYKKRKGRKSVEAGPLVHVLSVDVIPSDKLIDRNKPLTIYGRIYAEYLDKTTGKVVLHDLFSRNCDEAQVLGPSGGPLTLIGPDDPDCFPFKYCKPLNNTTRVVVIAFMGEGNNLFAEKQLCCGDEDMTIDMEKVKIEYVHGELFSLALRYIAMPFAVYGHVEVVFIYKESDVENLDKRSINVKGRIVARYGNNLRGSECTLFERQYDNEFERVENDPSRGTARMRLSRCVLGVPAYSSLILDLDLSEFGTGRKILKETVEFQVEGQMSDDDFIVDDDTLVRVTVGWITSSPQGRQELIELDDDDDDDESSAVEMLCDDDHIMDEASCIAVASSYLSRPWTLHPISPYLTSSVEIFSVFIGREKYKPLQVYGSIQVASDDEYTFYVFKRDTKNDAFGLTEHSKTLPLLDGSRAYSEGDTLKMKIDLRDVESQWHIKGYVKWGWQSMDEDSPLFNKQLCSVIQGERGAFAAIHYSIFSEEADYAIVGLMVVPKKGRHVRPKVHGSLVAQYNDYDYTSRYNKDYYRVVLFQRNRDDAAQPGVDGFIPLSRSVVAVPKNSSLVIEANIGDGLSDELSFQEREFDVGTMERDFIMEGNGYSIYLYVKWERGF
ncbi:hypothetical protein CASFOL_020965 [Castilleja foliolosa]|uniref:DUF6598 domain-containing protein n=1 Tax=Castilleja foliolosa TaxID=1961234 RepID=A0ABD3D2C2_9LAMI